MMKSLAPIAAVLLAAPVVAQPGGPDRISYAGTGNGWSGGRLEWWIDRAGRGGYRSTIRGRSSGTFNAGPQGFARIRTLLQPLEGVRELPCDGFATDQGMGTLNWRRGRGAASLRFDFGCNFQRPDAARVRLNGATELIRRWAEAE